MLCTEEQPVNVNAHKKNIPQMQDERFINAKIHERTTLMLWGIDPTLLCSSTEKLDFKLTHLKRKSLVNSASVRGFRSENNLFLGQVPNEMAMVAIAFVMNHAENDSQMQQNRRQNEFARHLRIGNQQRMA